MRCFICDKEDDLISFDREFGTYNPCHTCQAVIDDCIAGYEVQEEFEVLLIEE